MARPLPATEASNLVEVTVNGLIHRVPPGRAELEQAIARGVELTTRIKALEQHRDAQFPEIVAQIKQLQQQLTAARAPYEERLGTLGQELIQVKSQVVALARPLMEDQKQKTIQAIAGTAVVTIEPKAEVPKDQVAAVTALLGDQVEMYFERTEALKPLRKLWDLANTPRWKRLARLLKIGESTSCSFKPKAP